jgi:hypothetical protein
MAGAEDLAFSLGLALLVGSLAVPPTSANFGTCCSEAGWGCSRFSGAAWCYTVGSGTFCGCSGSSGPHHLLPAPKFQSVDPEQMLKVFVTRGLPSLLWSALGPTSR